MNARVQSLPPSVRIPRDIPALGASPALPSLPKDGDRYPVSDGFSNRLSADDKSVQETLAHLGRKSRRLGPGRWQVALNEGANTWVDLTVDTGWLFLGLALPAGLSRQSSASLLWPLLLRNIALPWPVRYTLTDHRLVLRADLLRGPGENLLRDLEDALRALEVTSESGPRFLRTPSGGEGSESSDGHSGHTRSPILSPTRSATGTASELAKCPSLSKDEWLSLCREGGWDTVERGETLVVSLGSGGGPPMTAVIHPAAADGGARVSVRFECTENLAPASREALALFLLSTTYSLRLLRAEVVEAESSVSLRLAAGPLETATAADVEAWLSALSVGFEACAAEVSSLGEASLATDYLRIRGWSDDVTKTHNP